MRKPDQEGFLSRWSKRKLDGPTEEEIVDVEAPSDPEVTFDGKTDEEILEALKLPDPDTLTAGDDFKAFMNSAVPTRLRNRALRKLWVSNPVLANLDELLDYGEDFTDAATVVENLQTAYQVGRGFMTPEDEPGEAEEPDVAVSDEELAAPEASFDEREEPAPASVENAEEDASPDVAEPAPEAPELVLADAPSEPEEDLLQPRPRRMRFSFDG